jgi:transcriptional repressor NrdR
MNCPFCQHQNSKVIDTNKDAHGGIRRRRECLYCHQRFSTNERPILTTPMLIKQNGAREEFNRDKLLQGLRIACAKRPVPAASLEKIVDDIEAELQKMGRVEVNSRVVGDLAIRGLKELDHVAYIRYAIVYLRLDDLHAVRNEIDRLLSEEETI